VKWKERLKPKKVGLAIGVVFLALILSDFFFFCLENLTLELYVMSVQQILFWIFLFLSFLTLLIFLVKRKFSEALLGFLFPLSIYLLINFIFESILYASESVKFKEMLTTEELTLRNIVLGIDDLKVVLTIVAITLWCWVWLRLKEKR
jgi:hypothetical protein